MVSQSQVDRHPSHSASSEALLIFMGGNLGPKAPPLQVLPVVHTQCWTDVAASKRFQGSILHHVTQCWD